MALRNCLEEPSFIADLSRSNGTARLFDTCTTAANWRACSNPWTASRKSVSFGSNPVSLAANFGLLVNSESAFVEVPLQPGAGTNLPSQEGAPSITMPAITMMLLFRSFSCPIADIPANGIARTTAITLIVAFIFIASHGKERKSPIHRNDLAGDSCIEICGSFPTIMAILAFMAIMAIP